MAPKSVGFITMSLRPARIGGNIAALVRPVFEKAWEPAAIKVVPVDLRDFNLPIYNENVMPATVPKYAQFQHEHSKIWSAEIAKYDAYVLIISEYNCGLAGGTKNALDYLWNEWTGKPVIILSYGSAGGSLASAQLKGLLDMAKAQVVEPRIQLPFAEAGGEYGPIMAEGKISDKSRAKWEGMFGEITKAANELKALLSK